MPLPRFGEPRPRYTSVAGFVTTPACFDAAPQQFAVVAPRGVGIQERVLHVPEYEYALEQRAKNFGLLEEAAIALGKCDCEVVGQVGSNWVHCNGTSPDDIRRICDEISEKARARFLMAGMCLVDALEHIGAKRITIANGYYRQDWMDGVNRFLAQAGFEILWSGNILDQGIRRDLDEQLEIERATHWDYPARDVVQACHKAHLAAPDADAVVQTGAGFCTVPYIEAIEGLVEKPLVPSDVALYWAMLRALDLPGPHRDYGYLMATLS